MAKPGTKKRIQAAADLIESLGFAVTLDVFSSIETAIAGAHLNTIASMGLVQGSAEQEVRTPASIIARVCQAFRLTGAPVFVPGIIALDPCAPTYSPPSFFAERYVREAENGLLIEWVDRTFVNPPFEDLIPWLEKAMIAAAQGHRIVLLVPLRSHRPWFRAAMRSTRSRERGGVSLHGGGVVFEGGVRFEGHKANAPFPLVLLCWNCIVPGDTTGDIS